MYTGMGATAAVMDSIDLRYEQTYAELSKDVFRFVLAWTNDWGAAEELTHETFLRLWQHRGQLDWTRPMIPWLLVTARRLANNRFRALRRRIGKELPPRGQPGDEGAWARWLDVRAAFDRLTPLERTALILTAVEGWPYAEAAGLLRSSEGALRAAVSRARDKLEDA